MENIIDSLQEQNIEQDTQLSLPLQNYDKNKRT